MSKISPGQDNISVNAGTGKSFGDLPDLTITNDMPLEDIQDKYTRIGTNLNNATHVASKNVGARQRELVGNNFGATNPYMYNTYYEPTGSSMASAMRVEGTQQAFQEGMSRGQTAAEQAAKDAEANYSNAVDAYNNAANAYNNWRDNITLAYFSNDMLGDETQTSELLSFLEAAGSSKEELIAKLVTGDTNYALVRDWNEQDRRTNAATNPTLKHFGYTREQYDKWSQEEKDKFWGRTDVGNYWSKLYADSYIKDHYESAEYQTYVKNYDETIKSIDILMDALGGNLDSLNKLMTMDIKFQKAFAGELADKSKNKGNGRDASILDVQGMLLKNIPLKAPNFDGAVDPGSIGAPNFTEGALLAPNFTEGSLLAPNFDGAVEPGSIGAPNFTEGSDALKAPNFTEGLLGAPDFDGPVDPGSLRAPENLGDYSPEEEVTIQDFVMSVDDLFKRMLGIDIASLRYLRKMQKDMPEQFDALAKTAAATVAGINSIDIADGKKWYRTKNGWEQLAAGTAVMYTFAGADEDESLSGYMDTMKKLDDSTLSEKDREKLLKEAQKQYDEYALHLASALNIENMVEDFSTADIYHAVLYQYDPKTYKDLSFGDTTIQEIINAFNENAKEDKERALNRMGAIVQSTFKKSGYYYAATPEFMGGTTVEALSMKGKDEDPLPGKGDIAMDLLPREAVGAFIILTSSMDNFNKGNKDGNVDPSFMGQTFGEMLFDTGKKIIQEVESFGNMITTTLGAAAVGLFTFGAVDARDWKMLSVDQMMDAFSFHWDDIAESGISFNEFWSGKNFGPQNWAHAYNKARDQRENLADVMNPFLLSIAESPEVPNGIGINDTSRGVGFWQNKTAMYNAVSSIVGMLGANVVENMVESAAWAGIKAVSANISKAALNRMTDKVIKEAAIHIDDFMTTDAMVTGINKLDDILRESGDVVRVIQTADGIMLEYTDDFVRAVANVANNVDDYIDDIAKAVAKNIDNYVDDLTRSGAKTFKNILKESGETVASLSTKIARSFAQDAYSNLTIASFLGRNVDEIAGLAPSIKKFMTRVIATNLSNNLPQAAALSGVTNASNISTIGMIMTGGVGKAMSYVGNMSTEGAKATLNAMANQAISFAKSGIQFGGDDAVRFLARNGWDSARTALLRKQFLTNQLQIHGENLLFNTTIPELQHGEYKVQSAGEYLSNPMSYVMPTVAGGLFTAIGRLANRVKMPIAADKLTKAFDAYSAAKANGMGEEAAACLKKVHELEGKLAKYADKALDSNRSFDEIQMYTNKANDIALAAQLELEKGQLWEDYKASGQTKFKTSQELFEAINDGKIDGESALFMGSRIAGSKAANDFVKNASAMGRYDPNGLANNHSKEYLINLIDVGHQVKKSELFNKIKHGKGDWETKQRAMYDAMRKAQVEWDGGATPSLDASLKHFYDTLTNTMKYAIEKGVMTEDDIRLGYIPWQSVMNPMRDGPAAFRGLFVANTLLDGASRNPMMERHFDEDAIIDLMKRGEKEMTFKDAKGKTVMGSDGNPLTLELNYDGLNYLDRLTSYQNSFTGHYFGDPVFGKTDGVMAETFFKNKTMIIQGEKTKAAAIARDLEDVNHQIKVLEGEIKHGIKLAGLDQEVKANKAKKVAQKKVVDTELKTDPTITKKIAALQAKKAKLEKQLKNPLTETKAYRMDSQGKLREIKHIAPQEQVTKPEIVISKNTKLDEANGAGVSVLRKYGKDANKHYGNPFSADQKSGATVKVKSVAESVENFRKWLNGEDFLDVEPERRAWILKQIDDGKLDGKKLLYYTEDVPGGDYHGKADTKTYFKTEESAPELKKLGYEEGDVMTTIKRRVEKILDDKYGEHSDARYSEDAAAFESQLIQGEFDALRKKFHYSTTNKSLDNFIQSMNRGQYDTASMARAMTDAGAISSMQVINNDIVVGSKMANTEGLVSKYDAETAPNHAHVLADFIAKRRANAPKDASTLVTKGFDPEMPSRIFGTNVNDGNAIWESATKAFKAAADEYRNGETFGTAGRGNKKTLTYKAIEVDGPDGNTALVKATPELIAHMKTYTQTGEIPRDAIAYLGLGYMHGDLKYNEAADAAAKAVSATSSKDFDFSQLPPDSQFRGTATGFLKNDGKQYTRSQLDKIKIFDDNGNVNEVNLAKAQNIINRAVYVNSRDKRLSNMMMEYANRNVSAMLRAEKETGGFDFQKLVELYDKVLPDKDLYELVDKSQIVRRLNSINNAGYSLEELAQHIDVLISKSTFDAADDIEGLLAARAVVNKMTDSSFRPAGSGDYKMVLESDLNDEALAAGANLPGYSGPISNLYGETGDMLTSSTDYTNPLLNSRIGARDTAGAQSAATQTTNWDSIRAAAAKKFAGQQGVSEISDSLGVLDLVTGTQGGRDLTAAAGYKTGGQMKLDNAIMTARANALGKSYVSAGDIGDPLRDGLQTSLNFNQRPVSDDSVTSFVEGALENTYQSKLEKDTAALGIKKLDEILDGMVNPESKFKDTYGSESFLSTAQRYHDLLETQRSIVGDMNDTIKALYDSGQYPSVIEAVNKERIARQKKQAANGKRQTTSAKYDYAAAFGMARPSTILKKSDQVEISAMLSGDAAAGSEAKIPGLGRTNNNLRLEASSINGAARQVLRAVEELEKLEGVVFPEDFKMKVTNLANDTKNISSVVSSTDSYANSLMDVMANVVDPGKATSLTYSGEIPTTKIISGGQTGADTIGLKVGKELGYETGGTAPKRFIRESYDDGVSLKDFGLAEVSDEQMRMYNGYSKNPNRYTARTVANVADSDGTVYFYTASDSAGYYATKIAADKLGKPFLENPSAAELRQWLSQNDIKTLNVAGNRGSRLENSDEVTNILKEALTKGTGEEQSGIRSLTASQELGKASFFNDKQLNNGVTEAPSSRSQVQGTNSLWSGDEIKSPDYDISFSYDYNKGNFTLYRGKEWNKVNTYQGNIEPADDVVFVFGSNPEGRHGKGAALTARKLYGAEYGVGEGRTGNAYALPTKNINKPTTYEVSTAGDSRFSALKAKFDDGTTWRGNDVGGKTVEEVWQKIAKGSGKGKAPAADSIVMKEAAGDLKGSQKIYDEIWDLFLEQNPDLKNELRNMAPGTKLTDKFSRANTVSQATSLQRYIQTTGERSISPERITDNIRKMYAAAEAEPNKKFMVAYRDGKLLSGYTHEEMAKMFTDAGPAPKNVYFSEEYGKLIGPSKDTDAIKKILQSDGLFGKDYEINFSRDGSSFSVENIENIPELQANDIYNSGDWGTGARLSDNTRSQEAVDAAYAKYLGSDETLNPIQEQKVAETKKNNVRDIKSQIKKIDDQIAQYKKQVNKRVERVTGEKVEDTPAPKRGDGGGDDSGVTDATIKKVLDKDEYERYKELLEQKAKMEEAQHGDIYTDSRGITYVDNVHGLKNYNRLNDALTRNGYTDDVKSKAKAKELEKQLEVDPELAKKLSKAEQQEIKEMQKSIRKHNKGWNAAHNKVDEWEVPTLDKASKKVTTDALLTLKKQAQAYAQVVDGDRIYIADNMADLLSKVAETSMKPSKFKEVMGGLSTFNKFIQEQQLAGGGSFINALTIAQIRGAIFSDPRMMKEYIKACADMKNSAMQEDFLVKNLPLLNRATIVTGDMTILSDLLTATSRRPGIDNGGVLQSIVGHTLDNKGNWKGPKAVLSNLNTYMEDIFNDATFSQAIPVLRAKMFVQNYDNAMRGLQKTFPNMGEQMMIEQATGMAYARTEAFFRPGRSMINGGYQGFMDAATQSFYNDQANRLMGVKNPTTFLDLGREVFFAMGYKLMHLGRIYTGTVGVGSDLKSIFDRGIKEATPENINKFGTKFMLKGNANTIYSLATLAGVAAITAIALGIPTAWDDLTFIDPIDGEPQIPTILQKFQTIGQIWLPNEYDPERGFYVNKSKPIYGVDTMSSIFTLQNSVFKTADRIINSNAYSNTPQRGLPLLGVNNPINQALNSPFGKAIGDELIAGNLLSPYRAMYEIMMDSTYFGNNIWEKKYAPDGSENPNYDVMRNWIASGAHLLGLDQLLSPKGYNDWVKGKYLSDGTINPNYVERDRIGTVSGSGILQHEYFTGLMQIMNGEYYEALVEAGELPMKTKNLSSQARTEFNNTVANTMAQYMAEYKVRIEGKSNDEKDRIYADVVKKCANAVAAWSAKWGYVFGDNQELVPYATRMLMMFTAGEYDDNMQYLQNAYWKAENLANIEHGQWSWLSDEDLDKWVKEGHTVEEFNAEKQRRVDAYNQAVDDEWIARQALVAAGFDEALLERWQGQDVKSASRAVSRKIMTEIQNKLKSPVGEFDNFTEMKTYYEQQIDAATTTSQKKKLAESYNTYVTDLLAPYITTYGAGIINDAYYSGQGLAYSLADYIIMPAGTYYRGKSPRVSYLRNKIEAKYKDTDFAMPSDKEVIELYAAARNQATKGAAASAVTILDRIIDAVKKGKVYASNMDYSKIVNLRALLSARSK